VDESYAVDRRRLRNGLREFSAIAWNYSDATGKPMGL